MGLFATVSLRAVNVVLNVNPLWAKIFWYAGVGGFFVFFVYKFRYYTLMQEEIKRQGLTDKLLFKEELSSRDYELLGTIICKLSSGKDKINFFFIFLFSAVAIIVAVYMDLLKGR